MSHGFKVGDRVIVTENYDGRPTANEIGTITFIESSTYFEVTFDNPHYSSLGDKYHSGWFVPVSIVKPYQQPVSYDETWV